MTWRIIRFGRCKRCKGVGYIYVFGKGHWLPCNRCNWGNWRGMKFVGNRIFTDPQQIEAYFPQFVKPEKSF